MTLLYQIFGKAMYYIYQFVGNYGLAIIVFSILAKLILMPLTLKQQKSSKLLVEIRPEVEKIQKKYANNKEKQNIELQKLYKKNNYSPMSGCLPLLIQLPIILALYRVLQQPYEWVFTNGTASAVSMSFLWVKDLGFADAAQVLLTGDKLSLFNNFAGVSTAFQAGLSNGLYILPILSVVSQYFSVRVSMISQPQEQQDQMKMFNYMMVIMIGYLSFTLPAGVAIYWTIQAAWTAIQQYLVMREKPKKEVDM
jgi:YidC/Oxa1 family membrane protein insertase